MRFLELPDLAISLPDLAKRVRPLIVDTLLFLLSPEVDTTSYAECDLMLQYAAQFQNYCC